MSHENSRKNKKRRAAKRTVLFFCEGADDKTFLHYLKSIFARESGVVISIKDAKGGGANEVLANVVRQVLADKTLCMYDTDTGVDADIKRKVESLGIECIESSPCLEAFLFSILDGADYSTHTKCDKSKKEFESKYLNSKKRKQREKYTEIFPKALLEQKVKDIPNLKKIIDVMQGKF